MAWIHLVARTRGQRILSEWEAASRAWSLLRHAFPRALAACLMPNHLHLIGPGDDPERDRRSVSRVLVTLMSGRGPGHWEPVPVPAVVPDLRHLRRQVRYVALNPCRDGLCRDPLEWPWSTHRDVMGAVVDPWLTADSLAAAFGERATGFRSRLQTYVSADPSVSTRGTSVPSPAEASEFPEYGLSRIAEAVAAARRERVAETLGSVAGRRLFVSLARRQGLSDAILLARFVRVTAKSIRRVPRDAPDGLEAAALCLGDGRLLRRGLDGGPAPRSGVE